MMEKVPYIPQKSQETNIIESAMQRVETIMKDVVASDVKVLTEASKHILQAGGKRVRPQLVLLSYAAFDGEDFEEAAPIAAALELVHTASVVHDDINDHGVIRRGRPSVNAIWGRTFALLTGDFLFTKVYELMAPYGELNVIFADATVALVEGETLQASAVKESNFTRQVYMDIIARKTAALFKAGAMLGASLANAESDQIEAMGRYGFNIGLAFQIIDDILDLIGDEEELGKNSGQDLKQGRGIAAVDNNGDNATNVLDSVKAKLVDNIETATAQAQHLVELAIDELSVLTDSPAKSQLIDLANKIINRTH
ncbi:MAG: polyprenyl synthetase family protein [Aggregatilineales bacterium]